MLRLILNDINQIKASLKHVNEYLDAGGDPGVAKLQYTELIQKIDEIL